MNPEFWKLLFVMGRALYAPMRLLRLADQKTPAMDKLYYYVLQTDQMLPKYLQDAEECARVFMTKETMTMTAMVAPSTAGLMVPHNDLGSGEEEDDDNLMEVNGLFDDTEELVSSDDDE